VKKVGDFLYKLLFDREDALDALQLLFTAIVVVTLIVVWNLTGVTTEPAAVKVEALITLRWLVGLLVITAIPKWMIPSMVKIVTRGVIPTSYTRTTSEEIYEAPMAHPTTATEEDHVDAPTESTS
jgi:hypothetical protein